jgi:signal peptidase II
MNALALANGRALTVLAALVFLGDQATKYAVEHFTSTAEFRVLVPGFLNLVHTNNPGVAFGLLADSGMPWMSAALIAFSVAVIGLLVWLLATGRGGTWLGQTGLALILGGAAGNMLDRVVRRSVTDFIDFHIGNYHWYTFNIADAAIVVGAGFVVLELFHDWRHPSQQRAA